MTRPSLAPVPVGSPDVPRNVTNLPRHELLGLHATVSGSTDPTHLGRSGLIVDESREVFVLRDANDAHIRLAKRILVLDVTLPSGEVARLHGADITFRPEDRPKKVRGGVSASSVGGA